MSDWKDEELCQYGKAIRDAAIELLREIFDGYGVSDRVMDRSKRLSKAIGISFEELRRVEE
jgi:hypothetical protein